MENKLSFEIPFAGFAGTTFINCFNSAFIFMEDINLGGTDYECAKNDGKPCNSCGNCANGGSTPAAVVEKYFFLFDTVCGRSSLRCRYGGGMTEAQKNICETDFYDGGTEGNIDFLFGFAGYDYKKINDSAYFMNEIIRAVGNDRPAIARLNDGGEAFRVITGYDGESLISPDYANAQRRPENNPDVDEIEALYIFGEKIKRKYTFLDGLKRIAGVMEENGRDNLWGEYKEKIGWYGWESGDGINKLNAAEKTARMKRVAETMWHTFNCHNFAEIFRQYMSEKGGYAEFPDMEILRAPEFREHIFTISGPCHGYTHDLCWALIDLNANLNWQKLSYECGTWEMAQLVLSQIEKNDRAALEAVKGIIGLMEKN